MSIDNIILIITVIITFFITFRKKSKRSISHDLLITLPLRKIAITEFKAIQKYSSKSKKKLKKNNF